MILRYAGPAALLFASLTSAVHADITGVGFGAAPTNWTLINSTASPVDNLIDQNGHATGVDFSFVAPGSPTFFLASSGSVDPGSIPSDAPQLAGLKGDLFDFSDSGQPLSATFSGLTPSGSYNVFVFEANFGDGNYGASGSVTGSGAPVDFSGTIESNAVNINGTPGSSASPLDSYAIAVTASPTGTIAVSASALTFGGFLQDYQVSGLALEFAPSSVPEASSFALMGLTCCALAGARLYRKSGR